MRTLSIGSLVAYRKKAGIVRSLGKKVEIMFDDGVLKSLRSKDVTFLHQGRLETFSALSKELSADVLGAWELLVSEKQEKCYFEELCSLIYGEYSPSAAWKLYLLLNEQPYFKGSVDSIVVRSISEVEHEKNLKKKKEEQQIFWNEQLARLQKSQLTEDDYQYYRDVEELACGESRQPFVFQLLKISATPEDAHNFLLKYGLWDVFRNPYPQRSKLQLEPAQIPQKLPALSSDGRVDLRHLSSWAIDDAHTNDPDDAFSLDGDTFWVHIADVAADVYPNSELDRIAQERCSTLYLPKTNIAMLPRPLVERFGIGLGESSPALSFALDTKPPFTLKEYFPSWICAQRLSYHDADQLFEQQDPRFSLLEKTLAQFSEMRAAQGAIHFQMPETSIAVENNKVEVKINPLSRTRKIVGDIMVLTGYAVAKFCLKKGIAIPFLRQDPPKENIGQLESIVDAYLARKKMSPSTTKVQVDKHAGLGLECYTRPTSPLRRYLDLLVHQQLRAYYFDDPLLNEEEVAQRINESIIILGRIRNAMRNSQSHWLLVYLLQQKRKNWSALVLEVKGSRGLFYLLDIGLEIWAPSKKKLHVGDHVGLRYQGVDLAYGQAYFSCPAQ